MFAAWIGITSAVKLGAGLLACVEPGRRPLSVAHDQVRVMFGAIARVMKG